MYFEHKLLYRSIYQEVPSSYYTLPFGVASLVREGSNVSIITFGAGVHWALELLDKHPEISADLLDLRSLQPLDTDAILRSVKKTNRVLILQEDTLFGGIASDISSLIMEQAFEYLDAPVQRVGSLETAIPFMKSLEDQYLPKARFEKVLFDLLAY
jgi:2-oxoisovalerate dehydrogenase E1 component